MRGTGDNQLRQAAGYKPNTYSIDVAVWFFNSGAFWMMNGHMRAPTSRQAGVCHSRTTVTAIASIAGMMLHCGE